MTPVPHGEGGLFLGDDLMLPETAAGGPWSRGPVLSGSLIHFCIRVDRPPHCREVLPTRGNKSSPGVLTVLTFSPINSSCSDAGPAPGSGSTRLPAGEAASGRRASSRCQLIPAPRDRARAGRSRVAVRRSRGALPPRVGPQPPDRTAGPAANFGKMFPLLVRFFFPVALSPGCWVGWDRQGCGTLSLTH